MKRLELVIAAAAVMLAITGCSSTPEPAPTVTVTITATPAPAPTVTITASPTPDAAPTEPESAMDLTTDAGLCAADSELTNLELNDAIAPTLGFSGDRDLRTPEQDEAIRAHKNAAFERECPARAG